jgi:hypothetical protein
MRELRTVSLLLLAWATLSCGGAAESQPTAASPAAPENTAQATPGAEQPVVGPPEVAWKDMTKEQRGEYMKAKVMPKMKELFTAFDAQTFASFNCATCHGPGAKDKSFHMPNPEIFVLPATPAEFETLAKEKPKWVQFMGEQVKPEMAKLLGQPEFDPKKPEAGGFGCGACHTMKGQSAKAP